jgi:hypothetical protein
MMSRTAYIRLAALFLFVFSIGLAFNRSGLSAERASAQQGLETSQRFSLPAAIQEGSGLAQAPASYSGYTEISDNEEKIKVQVPVEWSDIETGAWNFRGRREGVFLAASLDLGSFYSTGSQPGVLIGVSRSLARSYSQDGLLGLERRDLARQCTHRGRFDYRNPFYSGKYDHFSNCAGGSSDLLIFTTASADKKSLIFIRVAALSAADLEAVDTIINTFQVLGDPERDEHHE